MEWLQLACPCPSSSAFPPAHSIFLPLYPALHSYYPAEHSKCLTTDTAVVQGTISTTMVAGQYHLSCLPAHTELDCLRIQFC